MFDQKILPVLIDLRFDLAAPNPQISVLWSTSNVYENLRNDCLVLCFLVDTDGLGFFVLLSVNTSDVETNSTSIISLYCC